MPNPHIRSTSALHQLSSRLRVLVVMTLHDSKLLSCQLPRWSLTSAQARWTMTTAALLRTHECRLLDRTLSFPCEPRSGRGRCQVGPHISCRYYVIWCWTFPPYSSPNIQGWSNSDEMPFPYFPFALTRGREMPEGMNMRVCNRQRQLLKAHRATLTGLRTGNFREIIYTCTKKQRCLSYYQLIVCPGCTWKPGVWHNFSDRLFRQKLQRVYVAVTHCSNWCYVAFDRRPHFRMMEVRAKVSPGVHSQCEAPRGRWTS